MKRLTVVAFALVDAGGTERSLADFRGKTVVHRGEKGS